MAESEQQRQPPAETKTGIVALVVWSLVGLISSAAGFAVPLLLLSMSEGEAASTPPPTVPAFIAFGDAVVNLDEGRLTRYLRITVTLQVNKKDEEQTAKLVTEKKAILKSWLLSYLSDKSMDEIRGRAGQNRLRREIQDHFNQVLFTDGHPRINDVLFEEFNVQ